MTVDNANDGGTLEPNHSNPLETIDRSAQKSEDSDSSSTGRPEQIWDLLFQGAMGLVECADGPTLVLENMENVRQKAADIVRELSLLKRRIPAEPSNHADPEEQDCRVKSSAEFDAITQQISDQLRAVVEEALAIASRNYLEIYEYWQDADLPQKEAQSTLDYLCESLDSLGVNVPGAEERRIEKAALAMACNAKLLRLL